VAARAGDPIATPLLLASGHTLFDVLAEDQAMTPLLLLTVGLGVSTDDFFRKKLPGATLTRISSLRGDDFVLEVRTGNPCVVPIRSIKTYDLRGRPFTAAEAKKRLRADAVMLVGVKGTQSVLRDLGSDVLCLPRDTLIAIRDSPLFTVSGPRPPSVPISISQMLRLALIDRPRELLQLILDRLKTRSSR
jgi:hypothetical protein